jgi:PKD repeat protein
MNGGRNMKGKKSVIGNTGDETILSTTNRTVTHEYEVDGTYMVTVKVTYDDGAIITEIKEIVVSQLQT